MPHFDYKAVGPDGKSVSGSLEASDRKALVMRLTAKGLRPVSIDQREQAETTHAAEAESANFFKSDSKPSRRRFWKRSKSALALNFLKRLLVLLGAGMAIGDAVRLMSHRLSDPAMRDLCEQIWKKLSEGHNLASAMREMTGVFSPAAIHLVEAGEASGNLVPVIQRLVAQMEEVNEVRARMVANLTYPAFILGFSALVVVLLITFMLPKIQSMLEQLGGELPLITRMLVGGSEFVASWGLIILGVIGAIAIALNRWRRTERGKYSTDLWLLRTPLIGRIYLYANIFSTTNLMATLLGSGVNTTETLRLVEKTIPNEILRNKFAVARRQIQEGVSMATAIQRVHYMPDLAMDILTVGENTGNVVTSLNDINRIYRGELTSSLNFLTSATVAVALFGAFALVAIIAVSIVYAVLSVGQSIQL